MTDAVTGTADAVGVLAALVAGAALGALYLLGLWYTVRRQPRLKYPGVWLLLSMVGRIALLLGGFYLVMAGSPLRLLACVVGFLLTRIALTRRLGPRAALAARSSGSRGGAP
ncbi:MAG: ATP synthase subunit I [Thermoleophilia bacterium]